MRPKKVKPAIYEFSNDDLIVWQRAPKGEFKEASWGWVDIKELAEIIGLPAEILLDLYWGVMRGKIFSPYHRKILNEPALVLAINQPQFGNFYEIMYFNKAVLFNFGDRYHRNVCEKFLTKDVFVPAGWALAIIEEVNARKELQDRKEREEKKNA